MIKCRDGSKVLCIEEVDDDATRLAFYPEADTYQTVWLSADDVYLLAVKLMDWAKKRGANIPKSSVSGDVGDDD
jgi:hypothetical protein